MNEFGYPLITQPGSPMIDVLIKDLQVAKSRFTKTGLRAVNQHQKYKYAKINEIYDAVEPALESVNIIIIHQREWFDQRFFLITRLFHTIAQQWIQDVAPIENEKPGNQGHCIAATYMKKVAVLNLCGIATEEDDDTEEEQRYIEDREKNVPSISEAQEEYLLNLISKHPNKMDLWKAMSEKAQIKTLSDIKAGDFENAKMFITRFKALQV